MSMSGLFYAFSQQDIAAMGEDDDLINEFTDWEAEQKRYVFDLDILDAWDLFMRMFGDDVFCMNNVSYNECFEFGYVLLPAEFVKSASDELSGWTHEEVWKVVQNFSEEDDIYHLERLQGDGPELLLETFDALVTFYKRAAEKGLGVLFAIM